MAILPGCSVTRDWFYDRRYKTGKIPGPYTGISMARNSIYKYRGYQPNDSRPFSNNPWCRPFSLSLSILSIFLFFFFYLSEPTMGFDKLRILRILRVYIIDSILEPKNSPFFQIRNISKNEKTDQFVNSSIYLENTIGILIFSSGLKKPLSQESIQMETYRFTRCIYISIIEIDIIARLLEEGRKSFANRSPVVELY